MSAIYDALKKDDSQKKVDKENLNNSKRNASKLRRIFYVLIILCLFAIFAIQPLRSLIFNFLPHRYLKSNFFSKIIFFIKGKSGDRIKVMPLTEAELSVKAKDLPSISLTGIVLIDGQYSALINDQIVKPGDYIQEMQIEKIDSEGVEIKFRGSSFRLNYS